jgi:hypothetical protein
MYRRLLLLVVTVGLVLAASLVAPAAASAGGRSDTSCLAQLAQQFGSEERRRNFGGTGPAGGSNCTPAKIIKELRDAGLLPSRQCLAQLPVVIDNLRNVGGTVPADLPCPSWLSRLLVNLGRNVGGTTPAS